MGTINLMDNAVGKIMPIKARILSVMLYGRPAKKSNPVPREVGIVFHSLCYHESLAAFVAKISSKILTSGWMIHPCPPEFSESLKQQLHPWDIQSRYNVKILSQNLDVVNLQCFIISVLVKQHNMKEKNHYIMRISFIYKIQAL